MHDGAAGELLYSALGAMPEQEVVGEADVRSRGLWLWGLVALAFCAVLGVALATSAPQHPEEVFLHQIVVRVDPQIPGDRDRALAKIQRVRETLLGPGTDFSVVALKEDETINRLAGGSVGKPGEVGWIGRGMMSAQIEQVAFSLELREISEIVEDNRGFRVLMITDRRGGSSSS